MNVLLEITVLFTLAIALSFLIERLLEILKAGFDLIDSRLDMYKFWTKKTYKIRNTLENKLRVFEYVGHKNSATVLNKFSEKLMNETGNYSGKVPILSGNLVRAVTIKSWSKIIGIGIGIGLAFWMKVDLINIWQNAMSDKSYWILNIESSGWRTAISGVIIGLGSSPVHKVVSTIEKQRKEQQEKQTKKQKEVAS